ncbi:DUF3047 domain-containing protein [Candidatus Njordibacter sp. Uisw_002]|jgi:hypothetical protein|uniref:DUF3047 domain-containing protein n=1 Tax=Candidatus Njordibacter sp. Uisw_002 TaxID=3230971 RepID=UPI0029762330|nr:DUF3047 domain-containing protein [Oceanospirillaceae bacterium]|tara:strand:- start:20291 stop:20962 length:672 start_codon:yes stop_codon:yes gene_type:complete
MAKWMIMALGLLVCVNVQADNNITSLGDNGIKNWEPKVFDGESVYTVKGYQGQVSLHATSQNAASGLLLKQNIDLIATPHLSWSWLIKNKLTGLDERTKQGDDYAARIYVVIDKGVLVWKSRSLNYVWSSNQDEGLVWDNPFAGSRVKMMSVKGKHSNTNQWYQEQRNVYADLIATFGDKGSEAANRKAYQYINVIAIMTDTDNSDSKAQTYYGDLIFSALPN